MYRGGNTTGSRTDRYVVPKTKKNIDNSSWTEIRDVRALAASLRADSVFDPCAKIFEK